MAISRQVALPLLLLLLTGCLSPGLLYTRMTEPATEEFDKTPVGTKTCVVRSHKIREPVSGYGFSAEWDANYVKAAALKGGLTNVYYADLRTLSVCFGIYRQRELIVYGD